MQYEEFNIEEAFKLQRSKIENDWRIHETELLIKYEQDKIRVSGDQSKMNDSPSYRGQQREDARFQHPEKQRSLFNTVPVMSPTRHVSSNYGRANLSEASINWTIYFTLLFYRLLKHDFVYNM